MCTKTSEVAYEEECRGGGRECITRFLLNGAAVEFELDVGWDTEDDGFNHHLFYIRSSPTKP